MIRILLWDVDGTLLDFYASEREAIRTCFAQFGMGECSNEMLAYYSRLNRSYWERLERGEISKSELLTKRFEEFFGKYGLDTSVAAAFNKEYQVRLGDTIVFQDDSKGIVERFRGVIPQFVVSNGTVTAQMRKLQRSGFDRLMDGIFLSEELGYEKPATEFFDLALQRVEASFGTVQRDEVLIVGDSLTSDILGGMRSGIKTCWYNPQGKENTLGQAPDYEIRNLQEVLSLPEIVEPGRGSVVSLKGTFEGRR